MKKTVALLFLIYSVVLPLRAETDPPTAQFLRKLNQYYYCPSREGLKGFSCDLTVTLSDIYKKSVMDLGASEKLMTAIDGQKFTLSITAGGQKKLDWVRPVSTGDPAFDAQLQEQTMNIKKDLAPVFDTWTGDVFKPGFDEETLAKTVCTVSKQPIGFMVDQKGSDGSILEMVFDAAAKQTKVLALSSNGTTLVTGTVNYSSTPKGYQLDGYEMSMVPMSATESDRITNGEVGRFILPKRIVKELELGKMFKKGSSVTVDFSNYRLSQ